MMKFDELINSIDSCCSNDNYEDLAYQRIRHDIAGIKLRSYSAFDVKQTFKEVAHMAYEAAWEEAEEDFARRVIY